MCQAYTLTLTAGQLASAFAAEPPAQWQPHYNARPGQLLPVITATAPGQMQMFYWGAAPGWLKNRAVSKRIINTPADRALTRPAYARALQHRRCLVPADGFYTWKPLARKRQIPYRYTLADGSPFAFAGLWEEFDTPDNNRVHTFTLITTPANDLLALSGHEMPAILTGARQKLWLDPECQPDTLARLLNALPGKALHGYPVSPEIGRPEANHPGLIENHPPADQHGHYMLFD